MKLTRGSGFGLEEGCTRALFATCASGGGTE